MSNEKMTIEVNMGNLSNAAINILNEGLRMKTVGTTGLA